MAALPCEYTQEMYRRFKYSFCIFCFLVKKKVLESGDINTRKLCLCSSFCFFDGGCHFLLSLMYLIINFIFFVNHFFKIKSLYAHAVTTQS